MTAHHSLSLPPPENGLFPPGTLYRLACVQRAGHGISHGETRRTRLGRCDEADLHFAGSLAG